MYFSPPLLISRKISSEFIMFLQNRFLMSDLHLHQICNEQYKYCHVMNNKLFVSNK